MGVTAAVASVVGAGTAVVGTISSIDAAKDAKKKAAKQAKEQQAKIAKQEAMVEAEKQRQQKAAAERKQRLQQNVLLSGEETGVQQENTLLGGAK